MAAAQEEGDKPVTLSADVVEELHRASDSSGASGSRKLQHTDSEQSAGFSDAYSSLDSNTQMLRLETISDKHGRVRSWVPFILASACTCTLWQLRTSLAKLKC